MKFALDRISTLLEEELDRTARTAFRAGFDLGYLEGGGRLDLPHTAMDRLRTICERGADQHCADRSSPD